MFLDIHWDDSEKCVAFPTALQHRFGARRDGDGILTRASGPKFSTVSDPQVSIGRKVKLML
jgi:hypothetical protein